MEKALWMTTHEMRRTIVLCEAFDTLYRLGHDKSIVSLDSAVFEGVKVFDESGGLLGTIGLGEDGTFVLYFPTEEDK